MNFPDFHAASIRHAYHRTLGSLVVIGCLAAGPIASANFVNAGFETGNTTGWTTEVQVGGGHDGTPNRPAGSIVVTTNFPYSGGRSPFEGNNLLAIGTGSYFGWVSPLDARYDITVRQSISLDANGGIGGWAAFNNYDNRHQDIGFVRILDESGTVIATPWTLTSGADNPFFHQITPWTQWTWSAASTGTYTLVLGISTGGDNQQDTWALFDGLEAWGVAVPVPERTGTLILLLPGLLLLDRIGRKLGLRAR